jgi:hypothetical protein
MVKAREKSTTESCLRLSSLLREPPRHSRRNIIIQPDINRITPRDYYRLGRKLITPSATDKLIIIIGEGPKGLPPGDKLDTVLHLLFRGVRLIRLVYDQPLILRPCLRLCLSLRSGEMSAPFLRQMEIYAMHRRHIYAPALISAPVNY